MRISSGLSLRITTCNVLFFAATATYAQVGQPSKKLPDQQETGVRAPSSIKIDGRSTEWNDTFQAYNKTTQIFYTLSNDDTNLYLSVKASNSSIINKIIRGGLTFTVNTEGKKKEKESVSIMFPVPNRNDMRSMMTSMRGSFEKMNNSDPAKMMKQADSLMYEMNRQQIDKLKDLRVTGIAEIKDTLLSVYNEEGIKARALFDKAGAYNYELAVPLKYLGISTNNPKEFLYNLKLNGLMASIGNISSINVTGGGGGARVVDIAGAGGGGTAMMMSGRGGADIMSMMSPTDFWGKYTPVKK